mgnify:CR=1 FL=1|tara:strand:+ start:96 stop:335 length:240 start_codon:yes stop_codon:yes gene_type:complete
MMQLREDIIKALQKKFEGEISAHKINVEIMLENTVGIGEHSGVVETVEKELDIIAEYEDKLSVLKKYFVGAKKKEVLNG